MAGRLGDVMGRLAREELRDALFSEVKIPTI